MRRAIVVIGKAPRPGRVKTRLVPSLSVVDAAALYEAFLLDTVQTCLRLGWDRTTVVHPRGDGPLLDSRLPANVNLLQQPRTGLGDALAHAFEHHFASGFDAVTLVGSDNPSLPLEPALAAGAALRTEQDLALGPSADGGYYLIGMRAPHVGVFERIDWSTPRVYRQTVERAQEIGLNVHAVQEWYDVDEPTDLRRLQRELEAQPRDVAPRTRAVLERLNVACVPTRHARLATRDSRLT